MVRKMKTSCHSLPAHPSHSQDQHTVALSWMIPHKVAFRWMGTTSCLATLLNGVWRKCVGLFLLFKVGVLMLHVLGFVIISNEHYILFAAHILCKKILSRNSYVLIYSLMYYCDILLGCEDLAAQFLSQEIDGQALLLLKEEHLMSTMNIKLGPALKICASINSLRD